MLIELSDDQIETILDQIDAAMDEYGYDDDSIALLDYLYEKYDIQEAKRISDNYKNSREILRKYLEEVNKPKPFTEPIKDKNGNILGYRQGV